MADRELKYVCSPWSDRLVLSSLESRCQWDSEYRSNHVNSIYFDTFNWAFADEKAASDYLKTKVRIRWYESGVSNSGDGVSDNDARSPCYLEIKRKIGSTRQKARLKLGISSAELKARLDSSSGIADVRQQITNLAPDLGNTELIPRIHVRYLRHRYTEPGSGARIAFDSDITGTVVALAGAERFTARLQQSVLEVKGDEEDLPANLRFLHAPYLRKAAFSKYYECYCWLTRYEQ